MHVPIDYLALYTLGLHCQTPTLIPTRQQGGGHSALLNDCLCYMTQPGNEPATYRIITLPPTTRVVSRVDPVAPDHVTYRELVVEQQLSVDLATQFPQRRVVFSAVL